MECERSLQFLRRVRLRASGEVVPSISRLHAFYFVDITTDITWDNPGTAICSAIELNVSILCASLPTLRVFFQWNMAASILCCGTCVVQKTELPDLWVLKAVYTAIFVSTFSSRRVGRAMDNATEGQYYNMEGSIMVKTTITIQNFRAVETKTAYSHISRSCHAEMKDPILAASSGSLKRLSLLHVDARG